MNDCIKERTLSSLQKQTFIVACWLEGTLTGMRNEAADANLVTALQEWLDRKRLVWDDFLVGSVCCSHCGNEWSIEGFRSRMGKLTCPVCGKRVTGNASS